MTLLAKGVIWWPDMDSEIEYCVKSCHTCQCIRRQPMKAPLNLWIFTDRPWSRIHIDHCGPPSDKMLLAIMDSHAKWLELPIASTATSEITIEHLWRTFSTHGIPDTIVSHNAGCFTSNEFIPLQNERY